MSVEETRRNVKFDQPLTDAQKRRYERRDGSLLIRIEPTRRGEDATAHVDRTRD